MLSVSSTDVFGQPEKNEQIPEEIFAQQITENESLEYYAYMNLEEPDVKIQEKILEARDEIILSMTWASPEVVEGYFTVDGSVFESVPQFYDLFPFDWDIPKVALSSEEESQKNNNFYESSIINPDNPSAHLNRDLWVYLTPTFKTYITLQGAIYVGTFCYYSCMDTQNMTCFDISGSLLYNLPNIGSGGGYGITFSSPKYIYLQASSNNASGDALICTSWDV